MIVRYIKILHKFVTRYWPYIMMLAVPLVILGPLYGRGYILRYDMVFSPFYSIGLEAAQSGNGLYQSLLVSSLIKLLSFLMPVDIIQKLLLSVILFLCMLSIYKSISIESRTVRLLAGVMYTFNPFVYDRLMAGHWRFLLAYSITPFILKALFNMFTKPSRRTVLFAAGLWSLAAFANSHHILIIGVLFVCIAVIFLRQRKQLYAAATCVGLLVVANSWWLLPLVLAPNFTNAFGLEHFYAFATNADTTYGLLFNMLSMQGFWYEGWKSIKDYYAFWPLIFIFWVLPVYWTLGKLGSYSAKVKKLIFSLLLASIIAIVLAAGPAPIVSGLNSWLFTNVPGLSGLRESQKMLSLLVLAYSFIAAYGLNNILKQKRRVYAWAIIIPYILAIVLMALPMVWGAHGQIRTYSYPLSWYNFRDTLANDKSPQKAILLPWEIYVDETITNEVIANPARSFFAGYVVTGHRMLLPGVKDYEKPIEVDVSGALERKDAAALIVAAQKYSASYILITEKFGQGQYTWLENHPSIKKIVNNSELLVYKIDN